MTNYLRTAFLESASGAASLLGRSEVAEHWNEASVLPDFTISGLAGHLLRGIKMVEKYLDGSDPDGESISAAAYYDSISITPDISSPLNRDVRQRGEEEASVGSRAVALEAQAMIDRLATRLFTESINRRLQVLGDLVITLDEYLRTRVVELVLHSEDLALSVGLPEAAEVTPAVAKVAIGTLVDLARLRHGDRAVLQALARRERDSVDALRVLQGIAATESGRVRPIAAVIRASVTKYAVASKGHGNRLFTMDIPDIQTVRLQLHAIDVAEAERIVSQIAGPDDTWANDYPFEGDVGAVGGFLRASAMHGEQRPFGYYRITRLADGCAIGGVGFKSQPDSGRVEIGYGLVPSARGHGYASEAVKALLTVAVDHGLAVVFADTTLENIASQKTLTRAGFNMVNSGAEYLYYEIRLSGDAAS